jgi:TrmH family RNA methyltransferase
MITEITSASNEVFKKWKLLDSAKGIRKSGEFFLMGEKIIREFLQNCDSPDLARFKIKSEIVFEDLKPLAAGYPAATKYKKISTFKLSKGLFNEIDFIGTHFNLLLLELPEMESFDSTLTPQGLELVCPLGDPGNLGAVIRSALAFGASRVILTEEAAFPFSPKVLKASAGAVLHLPLVKAGPLKDFAQTEIYALDMEGSDLASFRWPANLRLLIGEEGPGLKDLRGLMKLKIDTGAVESLNATVAASIALYTYKLSKNKT